METTCRLCAKERPLHQLRRSFDDHALNIQQKLIDCCRWNALCPIEYDTMPKRICHTCYRKLEVSWVFAESVAEAQRELISKFGEGKPALPPIEHVDIQHTVIKYEFCDDPNEFGHQPDEAIDQKQHNEPIIILNKSEETEIPTAADHSIASHSSIAENHLVKLNIPENNHRFGDDFEDEPPQYNDPDYFDANDSTSESSNDIPIRAPVVKPIKRRYDARKVEHHEVMRKRWQKLPGSLSRLCDTCGMVFASVETLRRHVTIHSGQADVVKPFVCSTCSKRFRDKYSLKTHENTHTGAKPFECDRCDYRCACRQNLTKHYKQKHKIKMQAPKRMWVFAHELANSDEDGPSSSQKDE